jgi:hypothetical protein
MAIAKLSSLSSTPSSPPRAVAVAAILSITLQMNPSTFVPHADRCVTSGGPRQEFSEEPRRCRLSSPPPPPPPPTTTTSAALTPRGIFCRAAVYAAISSSTIQPTNQPTNFSVTVVQILDT